MVPGVSPAAREAGAIGHVGRSALPGSWMSRQRVPWGAVALLIAGGFFLFLGGLLMAVFGIVFLLFGFPGQLLFTGLLLAVLVWVMAGLLALVPGARIAWGVVVILLAILSLVFNFLGGLLIGFVLVLLGGLIAVFGRRGPRIPVPLVQV